MKLEPPTENTTPDARLQAEHNSLDSPRVRNDIGASPHITFAVQFIRAEVLLHGHGNRVLDTGCGNAELLRQLMGDIPHDALMGLDLEPAHVKLGRYYTGERLRIELGDFSEAADLPQFDFITAIGWVWKDYRHLHYAAGERRTEPEAELLDKVAWRAGRHLDAGGYFIHDWRTIDQQYDLATFQAALRANGLPLVHVIFEPLNSRLITEPAWSSLYVYRREA